MNQYTIQKTDNYFTLTDVQSGKNLEIRASHPKFQYVQKEDNKGSRIININNGKFTSSKDYRGHYNKAPQTTKPAKPLNITLTKLDDLNINENLFVPIETNTIFDKFASTAGGIMPGTNIMAAGAPGVGKTTVLLDLLSTAHKSGKKVLFISAEMSQIDMARYLQRFPHWGQLPILFLADYVDECPQTVINGVLDQGWDLVLTDSYTEVNDTVKEACNLTRGKVEKWFLDLMISNNKGGNKPGIYTTFITILQLSKGGQFVGSNKLKHMTTSMMSLDWEGGENAGRRYMEFSKNRVGAVNKKLYFSLEGGVSFDEARYARDLFNDELVSTERKQLETEADAFDKLFGFSEADVEDLEAHIEI